MVSGTEPEQVINPIAALQSNPATILDAVVQNTSGKVKIVTVTAILDSPAATDSAQIEAKIGNINPPTTVAASNKVNGTDNVVTTSLTFVVPPNFFYVVEETVVTSGVVTLVEWTEVELG